MRIDYDGEDLEIDIDEHMDSDYWSLGYEDGIYYEPDTNRFFAIKPVHFDYKCERKSKLRERFHYPLCDYHYDRIINQVN